MIEVGIVQFYAFMTLTLLAFGWCCIGAIDAIGRGGE